MKRFAFLFLSLTLAIAAQVKSDADSGSETAPSRDSIVETRVSKVTVYSRHALVTRTAELNLPAGEHRLVFGLLPANTRRESVQAGGRGAFVLRDVNVVDVPREKSGDERGKALLAALEQADIAIQDLQDQLQRLEEEKDYLEKVADKFLEKREKEGVAVELGPDNWVRILQALRQKRADLDQESRATERRRAKAQQEREKTAQELRNLRGVQQEKFPRPELTVELKNAGRIELEITYLVEGAGWGPRYELHVSSRERTMGLLYQAQVWQNTGEDWRNVRLSLSTANPDHASQHPDLKPWPVRFVLPVPAPPTAKASAPPSRMEQNFQEAVVTGAMANVYVADGAAAPGEAPPPIPEMEMATAGVRSGATAELYQISGASTIISDNQVHKVGIMSGSLPLHFRYSSVPKLSARAYLKAKAVNATSYTLLAGEASVFLDQSFVATTRLGRIARDESFWTFLGPDDDIQVEYKLVNKTAGDKGFISKKNTLAFESLATVSNRKKTEEEIVVWDQIPLPGHEDIKVTLVKPKYREDSDQLKLTKANFLEWYFKMKPGEKVEVPLSFTIEYPPDKEISIK